jgi:hypothetical protein
MEIPPQNRAENFSSYVLRVCSTIETVRIPLTSEANSFRESTKDKDSRVEKVNGKNFNCSKQVCSKGGISGGSFRGGVFRGSVFIGNIFRGSANTVQL